MFRRSRRRCLNLLGRRGAEYPAEHNVGHIYKAKPDLAAFYKSVDPTNSLNPGIGKMSRKKTTPEIRAKKGYAMTHVIIASAARTAVGSFGGGFATTRPMIWALPCCKRWSRVRGSRRWKFPRPFWVRF